jgi:hypothetical protein
MNKIIPFEHIEHSILIIRGQKVMLDSDLAALYGVETKIFNQAVKRNIKRFPPDFMFQLTKEEAENLHLRSQIVTLSVGWGQHRKYLPYVFTEFGVAMLSSILRSERAILVNIEIMRTFGRIRQILASHADLAEKLQELERRYDESFKIVFDVLERLMKLPEPSKPRIGFN